MNENITYSEGNENCYRKNLNGWIFVHVEGSPADLGYNYGYLLADEIISAVTEAKSLVEVQTGVPWEFFLNDESSIIHNWKRSLESYIYFDSYLNCQVKCNR